jgi:hypothetical protein
MSTTDEQVVEATSSNEEQELEINLDETSSDDVETLKSNLAKEQTAKNQILARAKKAEAELKALKGEGNATASQNINNSPISDEAIEIKILKAQGMAPDLIEQLQKISKVTGKSIIDAQSDPYFQSIKKDKEDEVKSAKAKLGASRGSGSVKQEKSFNTPGLTDAEFKQLYKEKFGK